MKGKTGVFGMITLLAFGMLAGEANTSQEGQRAQMQRLIEQEGGVVTRATAGGVIRVVLATDRIDGNAVAPTVRQMQGLLDRAVELGKMPPAGTFQETVGAAWRVPGTTIAIVVLEDGFLPSVVVAPEQGWAVVNVTALAADSPKPELLADRARKELWRALVWTLAESHETGCVMRHATNLKELDEVTTQVPSPDPMFRLVCGVSRRKLRSIVRATYRDACEEGWAPAPTNDVQKAIWEKVKADRERGPTNPITIPPPKR